MALLPVDKLKKLVKDSKWEELKAALKDSLESSLEKFKEQQKDINRLVAYLELRSEDNEKYLKEMEGLISLTRRLKEAEVKIANTKKVADIKDKIKGIQIL